jgi:hypothetical protein
MERELGSCFQNPACEATFAASCCTARPSCSRAGDWISPEQGLKASEFRQIEPTRPIERSAEAAPSQMPSPAPIRPEKPDAKEKG